MKFTVNKSDITEAVSNIQRAVSTKTSIPALEGILIGASEEGLELCAYDLELGITTVIPAFVVEPGKAVLSAKLFSDIVRRTPAETVTVTVDEKNMATLERLQPVLHHRHPRGGVPRAAKADGLHPDLPAGEPAEKHDPADLVRHCGERRQAHSPGQPVQH